MHEAVFADVEVAGARAAAPIILEAGGDIVLKAIDTREGALAERHDFFEDFALARAERLKLSIAVVEDADRGGEAELLGTARHSERVFRIAHAAAKHGIDVHLKFSELGEEGQLLV